ncbi:hypothetical protein J437_LFUL014841 [Ladona fulva]|uniref:Kazal-like domain-containing protein n=1 Tax=Ladona fulva TaxID=123851 RepID=A0A8K0KFS9_LADFU|nr:hypothetical protein J437_LFUL014841 [Ladona fulva]
MRTLILVLFIVTVTIVKVLATATASPATYFGGPTSRCLCNCPNPGLGNDVCAREGGGPEEMFPSRCYLECYNCTHGRANDVYKGFQMRLSPKRVRTPMFKKILYFDGIETEIINI